MPLYRIQLHSPIPPYAAVEKLKSVTRKPPGFNESIRQSFNFTIPPNELFLGSIKDSSFCICRNIRYRNSFLPRIRGKITAENSGSYIDISMQLHPFVAVFMTGWLFFVGLTAFALAPAQKEFFIPLGMFVFGILLTAGGFIPEAIKAKNMLTSLWFEAA
jgi:hypothetical protein